MLRMLDVLRSLARSGDRTKLIAAELRINEFLKPVSSRPADQRTSLENISYAAIREAASFWQGVRALVDLQLRCADA